MISQSNYPNANWLEFVDFIRDCEILDEKVNMSSIDRHFIATNVEIEQIEENPDRALCRYEFFEILVRIAGQKYKETKIVSTYAQAFEKLITELVIPKYCAIPWQDFREEYLWKNREVNLTLDVNSEGLQKIFNKYIDKKTKIMSYQSAIDIMVKDSIARVSFREATFAYGMSKMSVIYEMAKGPNPFKKMIYVEFLEYICRIAY